MDYILNVSCVVQLLNNFSFGFFLYEKNTTKSNHKKTKNLDNHTEPNIVYKTTYNKTNVNQKTSAQTHAVHNKVSLWPKDFVRASTQITQKSTSHDFWTSDRFYIRSCTDDSRAVYIKTRHMPYPEILQLSSCTCSEAFFRAPAPQNLSGGFFL